MPSKVIKACPNKRQKLSCGSENVVVVGKVSTKKPSSQEDDGNGELITKYHYCPCGTSDKRKYKIKKQ
jgi:hypothetical protein